MEVLIDIKMGKLTDDPKSEAMAILNGIIHEEYFLGVDMSCDMIVLLKLANELIQREVSKKKLW